MCTFVHVHISVEASDHSSVLPQELLFETVLLTDLDFAAYARQSASEVHRYTRMLTDIPVSMSLTLGLQGIPPWLASHASVGLNSVPHNPKVPLILVFLFKWRKQSQKDVYTYLPLT